MSTPAPTPYSTTRRGVLALLEQAPTGLESKSMAASLGVNRDTVLKQLVILHDRAQIHVGGWGKHGTAGRYPAVWLHGPGIDAPAPGGHRVRPSLRAKELRGLTYAHQSVFVGGINPWKKTARAPQ